ncbi:hypothetical protein M4578_20145 [Salipiger sp. P9]|uniref:hypothetical protein n=1 Tax=Salipiger pentaromativorans TaxID=2943193 RepID=UPI0021575434|nr:hypothetical protein [Salipiger pentaromativorans]MCR8550141.1 hypothetical protein [Salipiger pentaromativorans]
MATGHPLGLPAVPDGPPTETKVQPVSEQAKTGADAGPSGQTPARFWRGLSGQPDPARHVAPPSIVQIKISAILEKQAEKLLNDAHKAVFQDSADADRTPPADTAPPPSASEEAEPPHIPAETAPDASRSKPDPTVPDGRDESAADTGTYGPRHGFSQEAVFAPAT